jgi:NAD+ synthase (glutamine-hydrolysing)
VKTAAAMRLRLEQIEVEPGRPRQNTDRMLARVAAARADGVDLVAFPELAVPGCFVGDAWERPAFLRECQACGESLVAAADGIVVAFGNVAADPDRRNEDGRVRKYNALIVAEDRRALAPVASPYPWVIKTLLPNYRCFDDSRHFCDGRKAAAERGLMPDALVAPVPTSLGLIGGMLCEDAWDADYVLSPGRILAGRGARLLLNASCSPFTRDKNHKRNRVFGDLARTVGRPLAYVNATGVQDIGKTVYVFDGGSCLYDGRGGAIEGPPAFEEGSLTFDLPGGDGPFGHPVEPARDDTARIAHALLRGTDLLRKRLGIRRVVVGVSGGIDSATVAALYGCILPPEDLLLLNLPGPFSSNTTRSLARALADNLGCLYAEVPIGEAADLTRAQFAGLEVRAPGGRRCRPLALDDFAFENVQARDRGARVLAAAAAAFGGVFTCNANKAEITVGYGTLYGDIAGWLASIGDLWKGQVYDLARHLNEAYYGRPAIPEGIFRVVPSAELSAAQAVDEGRGDPLVYPYHDRLFRSWVERWNRATPEEILEWYLAGSLEQELGYEGRVADLFPDGRAFVADLERWWNLYQGMGVAKRLQAPPILAVTRRAFGFDHREAQFGPVYTGRYQELRRRAVSG